MTETSTQIPGIGAHGSASVPNDTQVFGAHYEPSVHPRPGADLYDTRQDHPDDPHEP